MMKKKENESQIFSKKLAEMFKGKNKKTSLLVVAGIIGIVLILLGELFSAPTTETILPETATFDDNAYNEQYVTKMQADLTAFISQIEGAGPVEVLVTLETGVQYVYATNEKVSDDSTRGSSDAFTQRSSSESSVIIVDGQNGREPLVLKRIEPTVMGVVVVCGGAGNAAVRQQIVEAVSTLCGIGTNRVSVVKMA